MTFLDETRFHYFSLDSDQDLSTATLSLSTQDPAVWVVAAHTTAPASAGSFPAPAAGLTRYWWKALFGPGEQLSLVDNETPVDGVLVNGAETIHPTWVIYEEDPGQVVPYCWPIDVACLGTTWNGYDAEVQDRATRLAVESLRMLTGYRVGGCPVTVRPCARGQVTYNTWQVYPVTSSLGAPIGAFSPALVAGNWTNVACGCTSPSCSCTALSEVILPGSPGHVSEVKVDGVILAASAYAVHDGNRLTRLDGDTWPLCQDMTKPDTEPDTFSVTYATGPEPGPLGAIAAGRLAAEFALACVGKKCALPARVRTVSRQGVTLDLAGADGDQWPGGLTGLHDVDVFIRRWNPYALRTASSVWSPDLSRTARRT